EGASQVGIEGAHEGLAEEVEWEIASKHREAHEPRGCLVVPDVRGAQQRNPHERAGDDEPEKPAARLHPENGTTRPPSLAVTRTGSPINVTQPRERPRRRVNGPTRASKHCPGTRARVSLPSPKGERFQLKATPWTLVSGGGSCQREPDGDWPSRRDVVAALRMVSAVSAQSQSCP